MRNAEQNFTKEMAHPTGLERLRRAEVTIEFNAYSGRHFVYNARHALVAQLDRVLPSEGGTA